MSPFGPHKLDECMSYYLLIILSGIIVTIATTQESARWIPSFNVLRFHGPHKERARLKEELRSQIFDLVVATYEAYVSECAWCTS